MLTITNVSSPSPHRYTGGVSGVTVPGVHDDSSEGSTTTSQMRRERLLRTAADRQRVRRVRVGRCTALGHGQRCSVDACGAYWCDLGAQIRSGARRGNLGSASLTAPGRPLQRREHVSLRLRSSAGRSPACKTMRGRTDRSRSAHACCRDPRDVWSRHGMCRCRVNAARCEAGELAKPAHRARGRRRDEHECLRPRSSRSGLPRCRPAESSICARQQPEQSEVQHSFSLGAFRAHK